MITETLINIKSEMGELIRIDSNDVRLIKEHEKSYFGNVGEVLFKFSKDVKLDKRFTYKYKGKILSVYLYLNEKLPKELLMLNLNELQQYFDEVEKRNNIL